MRWLGVVRAKAGACIRACLDSWQLCKDKGILMSAHNSGPGRVGSVKRSGGGGRGTGPNDRAAQTCASKALFA
jgi:hypothetical protein